MQNHNPQTPNPIPYTIGPEPQIPNPKPYTLHPNPQPLQVLIHYAATPVADYVQSSVYPKP